MVFLNQPNKKQIQEALIIICRVFLSLNTVETAKLSLFFPGILFFNNCSAYFLICTKNVLEFRIMVSSAMKESAVLINVNYTLLGVLWNASSLTLFFETTVHTRLNGAIWTRPMALNLELLFS